MKLLTLLALAWFILAPSNAAADGSRPLSHQDKGAIIEALGDALKRHYIHQDQIGGILAAIDQKHTGAAYAEIRDADEFARQLSADLINISQDFHFSVMYAPQSSDGGTPGDAPNTMEEDAVEALERSNFGFQKLEILEGNVGYVRFDYFPDPAQSFDAGAGAMRFVENTDALIIDMRYNRGGHNQFGQFITSYLFPASDHLLVHEYAYMDDGALIEGSYWTLPTLPGKRLVDTPVYILTSTTTFSAGEWFAFELQKLGRAKLVGETTTGASHAVNRVRINDQFLLQVPVGIGRDPIDKSDFEGVGVHPDILVDAYQAKAKAHAIALETLAERNPKNATDLNWFKPIIAARLTPPMTDAAQLDRYLGAYNGRTIERRGAHLVYRWRERFNLTLVPLGAHIFAVDGDPNLRFKFIEEAEQFIALEKIDRMGGVVRYDRTT